MTSDEMFNWPDGDVILRTHGSDSRDFQVHKLILSLASPVFKDMFAIPQPSSETSSNVDIVDVTDAPRPLELILQFIYPSTPPVIDSLTLLSEVLILADKYDIEAARSRLRPTLVKFEAEPLRAYAIACRLGYKDEMKATSAHTLSINLPALVQLPDEFEFVSAADYHRLIRLHTMYRKEVAAIAIDSLESVATPGHFISIMDALFSLSGSQSDQTVEVARAARAARVAMKKHIVDTILKGTPLDYGSFTLALKTDYGIDVEAKGFGDVIRSILDRANVLNLTA